MESVLNPGNGKLERERERIVVPRPFLGICMPTASYEDDPDLSRDDRIGWDQEVNKRRREGGRG